MPDTIFRIQDSSPEQLQALANQAGDILRSGGLVIFPTETVYGVAASAASSEGVAKLRQLKQRENKQPFTLHLPDTESISRYANIDDDAIKRLIRKSMPGPITLIVEVSPQTIAEKTTALGFTDQQSAELYFENTVGLRCPDHLLGQIVLAGINEPVVASSANLRGEAPPIEVESAAKSIGNEVDLIVDGGPCRYAKPSTIVRLMPEQTGTEPKWTIVREGVYDARMVDQMTHWNLLFVCTGNTCRSPMAEVIAKQVLGEQRGVSADSLAEQGVHVQSAGAFAGPGMPATPEAQDAMRELGMDLSAHRSKALTEELVNQADAIYCMTEGHRTAIVSMMPRAAEKTTTLDPQGDIDDPIGGSQAVYQQCAAAIRKHIEARLADDTK